MLQKKTCHTVCQLEQPNRLRWVHKDAERLWVRVECNYDTLFARINTHTRMHQPYFVFNYLAISFILFLFIIYHYFFNFLYLWFFVQNTQLRSSFVINFRNYSVFVLVYKQGDIYVWKGHWNSTFSAARGLCRVAADKLKFSLKREKYDKTIKVTRSVLTNSGTQTMFSTFFNSLYWINVNYIHITAWFRANYEALYWFKQPTRDHVGCASFFDYFSITDDKITGLCP